MSSKDESSRFTAPKFASFKAKETPGEIKAPKFSSFKPKEPEKPTGSVSVVDDDHDRESKRKRIRLSESRHSDGHHRRHHPRSHRHDSDRRHKEHSKPPSRSQTPVPQGPKVAPPLKEDAASNLYFVDTKGDPLILKYGGVDKSQIPSYYRYGYGRVLGTTGRLVIHREGARDQFSLRMPGEGTFNSKDREGLRSKTWRVTSNPRRIRVQEVEAKSDEDEDFLPLRTSKKRKHSQGGPESSEDEQQPSYRSIEGKAKARQFLDSDLESDSESTTEPFDTDQHNPLKWKSIQLSRQVKDHPDDIGSWLELANHQDALLRAGEDIDHKALEGEVHSYAEIKLSMLESALTNASDPEDRLRVLIPLMHEGNKVWNSKVAAKKWAELLKEENKSFALWKTHLDFAMSNIATFHYDDIKKMHLDRLHQTIRRPESDASKEKFSELIYVFLRATRFIHDSGYKELAVAAWQAVLELNLFRPAEVEGYDQALSEFRDFWESEVPRIGDPDAQGWAKFVEADGMVDPPEPIEDEGDHGTESRDDYKVWASIERGRAEKARIPARTMDAGTEDDPFRVVMFSDIEQLLFVIPRSVLPGLVPQLTDAFLVFTRLPPAFTPSEWTEDVIRDQFLARPAPGMKLPMFDQAANIVDISEEIQRKPPSFNQGGLCVASSLDTLFAETEWFTYLPQRAQCRDVELTLVVNVTRQLVHAAGIEGLGEYYLGLCLMKYGTGVKKQAKALLKRYPTNLKLYGAYALAEFANNNPGVATKVLTSATELASQKSPGSGSFLLWRIWSSMELDVGHKNRATRRLCSSVDEVLGSHTEDGGVSQTVLLRAQQTFSSNLDHSIFIGNLNDAAIYVECLALLAYLTADGCKEPTSTAQGNISAAMEVIHSKSGEFKSQRYESSKAHERALQFAARILYLNATRGPFRRAYMLEQLSMFIAFFPRNTMFLSLFEWADSSLRVVDEVRTLLHEKVLVTGQDCMSSRLFSIQHEIRRGNVNTAKAAFEHAVASDVCKFSVPVWVMFIQFCGSQRELRAKAKDVLFRALRHCPWSKDVMMEAFYTVSREMESTELRGVFDTMTTKGLRVHVDLDEFLEKRQEKRRGIKDRR
ncbi:NRDE-2, necessary for RNA interference-domain-containing protein [Dactylonectria estremocensis]|uniref:NRDE-2, necessary for RNA interference-domain-containing protein n=1 Tax=Dactylonectria estremocensis TaxID=1079267 RepID=A0A9P9JDD6_9HYPO|nr:NRDE-2, necessary for RNA interference-domain-containing protein [Dactylonectria estremocensis]